MAHPLPALIPLTLTLTLALALPAPQAAADEASPWGINTHIPTNADLDAVAAAGIGWVRIDLNWFQLEPGRDRYDWSIPDRVIGAARARGLEVYATLAYTPAWANGGQDIATPPLNPADWTDFVSDVTARYRGQVRHWGLWNEPNLAQFWRGTRDQYIDEILRPGAAAVKAANPSALVLGPELAHLSSANWAPWMWAVLEEAGDSLDIITHHIYESSGAEVILKLGVWAPAWERPLPLTIIEATGNGDKPFWLTETGWRTNEVTEAQQAASLTQVCEGVRAQPWLDKVFFYELKDDPNIPEKWGILQSDGTPKAGYGAYQAAIAGN